MRAAIVQFAFECLGASVVTSGAFTDNLASRRVSEATGYEENGTSFVIRRGQRSEQIRYLLTRERWNQTRSETPATVRGFDACRDQFELESTPTNQTGSA